jgi:hypothetical protein
MSTISGGSAGAAAALLNRTRVQSTDPTGAAGAEAGQPFAALLATNTGTTSPQQGSGSLAALLAPRMHGALIQAQADHAVAAGSAVQSQPADGADPIDALLKQYFDISDKLANSALSPSALGDAVAAAMEKGR